MSADSTEPETCTVGGCSHDVVDTVDLGMGPTPLCRHARVPISLATIKAVNP